MSQTAVLEMLKLLKTKEYVDTAAGTLLIWDYILTFRHEASLIWGSRWSWIKVLYIITKYLTIGYVIGGFIANDFTQSMNRRGCKAMFNILGWCNVLAISAAEVILFVRTSAIWGNTKQIKIILATLAIGATIPAFFLAGIFLATVEVGPSCAIIKSKSIVNVELLFMFLYDLLVLILTAIKAVPYYRDQIRDKCRIKTQGKHTVQHVLYRDGVIFYVYLLTLTIVNSFYALRALDNAPDGMVLQNLQLVLHSVVSSHVILNVRKTSPAEAASSPTKAMDPIQLQTFGLAPVHLDDVEPSGHRV